MDSIDCKTRLYKEQGTGVFQGTGVVLELSLCHPLAPSMVL